ncbi:AraC family transcriptional regulator [Methylobacterium planeticum]|uniref:AraC family transcriptional regulator n=2 Tax=Methylobacterium planeticum TaxID=2615211 RepID=A0A6N6MNE3_9HYPH|nr:AraC family transcriptional regulator [Methylobacterium planeticum]
MESARYLDDAGQALPAGFIHVNVLQTICTVLVEHGTDPDDLVTEAGIDPRVFGGGKFVPFTAVGRLIALAADRTGCTHFGLLIGQRTTLTSLGLIGLLMRNSDTVGNALRALEAHLCVRNRGAAVGLGVHDDIAVLTYAPHEPEAKGAAHHAERGLAKTTNLLRALCGSEWTPLEVLLPRSMPHDISPYAGFFRAPIRFDEQTAALVFPTKHLAERIADADPAVRQRVEDSIRQLEAAEPSSLTDELRQYLRTEVTRQRCKAERVARLRLVDRRTLGRRLKAEGTTFTRLANEAQYRVAKQLLADTRMDMTQISVALNFSEPAAFTHAFRRWSGTTPSAWRQVNQPTGRRTDVESSGTRTRPAGAGAEQDKAEPA